MNITKVSVVGFHAFVCRNGTGDDFFKIYAVIFFFVSKKFCKRADETVNQLCVVFFAQFILLFKSSCNGISFGVIENFGINIVELKNAFGSSSV